MSAVEREMAEKALDNHQYMRLEVAFSFSPKEFHPWFPEPQQTLTRSQHVVSPFFGNLHWLC